MSVLPPATRGTLLPGGVVADAPGAVVDDVRVVGVLEPDEHAARASTRSTTALSTETPAPCRRRAWAPASVAFLGSTDPDPVPPIWPASTDVSSSLTLPAEPRPLRPTRP